MTIKQLLEPEKKIRTLSMLHQQDILGASQLNTSKQVAKCMDDSIVADSVVTWLADFFSSVSIDNISKMMQILLFITLDAASPVGVSAYCVKNCWLKAEISLHFHRANQMKKQNSLN